MEAAGIFHTNVRFVVLPDDPALGEFRNDFAGVLGTIQEYPTPVSDTDPGFAGATEIIDHEEMWKRLEASPANRIDSRAYLRARLVDLFIGDWDRHRKQWRWALIPGNRYWQPIPEDRDWAFARFDGLLLNVARYSIPYLPNFGAKFHAIENISFIGWDLDRYILSDLEQPAWKAIASDLQTRLTDSVIEAAIKRLPPEYFRIDSARFESVLKKRRDQITKVADQFYFHLARKVDIHMTDKGELVEISRIDDNTTEIHISLRQEDGRQNEPEPYYRRQFHRNETKEIRLYLRAGNDKVISRGGRHKTITIRVIGNAGYDTVDDSQAGGLRVSNSTGNHRLIPGPGTWFDPRKYVQPIWIARTPWVPPRDWGKRTIPLMWSGFGPELGVFLGSGFTTTIYGFRKHPFSVRHTLRGGYATKAKTFRMDYLGEFHMENSGAYLNMSARASGIEILRFYGFGNETTADRSKDYYRVNQEQYFIEPSLTMTLIGPLSFTTGPIVKFSRTKLEQDRLIRTLRPYGTEDFAQLGFLLGFRLDMRNRPRAASKGFLISFEGRYYPQVWDVQSPFGEIHGEASAFLSASSVPIEPTLALRVGGKHVFGTYPFHEAAFLGGGGDATYGTTIRGFNAQRFAGDSSLYGNAEFRLRLGDIFFFIPGEMGVFGLGDVGRVFLDGEESKKWHSAFGGGIWLSFLDRASTISISFARSDERTSLYVRVGFLF